jgi:hypothetical protein
MKRQFLPYYISRALISVVVPVLIFGFTWKSLLFGVVLFGFFLLYLHSGWFQVDPTNGLFPLRRDARGQQAQRKALIIAVCAGLVAYFALSWFSVQAGLASAIPFTVGVLAYFASQFVLLARA